MWTLGNSPSSAGGATAGISLLYNTLVRYQTVRQVHIITVIHVMTGFQIGEECQYMSRWIVKQERTLT